MTNGIRTRLLTLERLVNPPAPFAEGLGDRLRTALLEADARGPAHQTDAETTAIRRELRAALAPTRWRIR